MWAAFTSHCQSILSLGLHPLKRRTTALPDKYADNGVPTEDTLHIHTGQDTSFLHLPTESRRHHHRGRSTAFVSCAKLIPPTTQSVLFLVINFRASRRFLSCTPKWGVLKFKRFDVWLASRSGSIVHSWCIPNILLFLLDRNCFVGGRQNVIKSTRRLPRTPLTTARTVPNSSTWVGISSGPKVKHFPVRKLTTPIHHHYLLGRRVN